MELIDDSKVMYIDQAKLKFLFPDETRQYKELLAPEQVYNFVNYDGTEYYWKCRILPALLNELVGEALSQYFNLATVKSYLVSLNKPGDLGRIDYTLDLFTKLFFEDGWRYTCLDSFPNIIFDDSKIGLKNLKNLNEFEEDDGKRWKIIKSEQILIRRNIKKMLIRDFLADQRDRHLGNYMFGYKDKHVKMMPLYDYEYSFNSYYNKYFDDFNLKLNQEDVVKTLRKDPYFQMLLKKALALKMGFLLERIEKEYNVLLSDEEKDLYISGIEERQQMILKRKLIV